MQYQINTMVKKKGCKGIDINNPHFIAQEDRIKKLEEEIRLKDSLILKTRQECDDKLKRITQSKIDQESRFENELKKKKRTD